MSLRADLPYGQGSKAFDLRTGTNLGMLELPDQAGLDPVSATEAALRKPVAGPPLVEQVRPGERVVILVSDVTRAVETHLFLPVILNELNRAGVPDRDIAVLFATGAHRAQTWEERFALVGEEVARRVPLAEHDARADADLVWIGRTSRGTEVRVNRLAARADLVIMTGAAVFHDFAGFSGGRKAVLPGISAYDAIQHNHSLLLDPVPGRGRHPLATSGVLDGNPVHEDMLEAAQFLPRTFVVNVVLNSRREIAAVVAGPCREAHAQACRIVTRLYGIPIAQRADLVLASCGGYPRDISFYQATKAIDNASHAVADGGVMILVAECREGYGEEDFPYWFGALRTVGEVDAAMRRQFSVIGYFSLMIRQLTQLRRVTLIGLTGLDPEQARLVDLEPARTPGDALARAETILGPDYTYYVMPNGSFTLPVPDDGSKE